MSDLVYALLLSGLTGQDDTSLNHLCSQDVPCARRACSRDLYVIILFHSADQQLSICEFMEKIALNPRVHTSGVAAFVQFVVWTIVFAALQSERDDLA